MRLFLVCLVVNLYFAAVVQCVEPITASVVAMAGAAGVWLWGSDTETTKTQKVQSLVDKFKYCSYVECCSAKHIPYDIDGLKADFNEHLYGQHIANATIIPALKSHINNLDSSQKPLVMSFHGTPGTGKNYVADFISRRFYAAGDESKYVHRYRGRIDFPLDTQVSHYRVRLKDEILSAVSSCKQSLFIFDEVDKMPAGVFESLASLLDHHRHVGGIDFRQAIFIFLSNAGGIEIGTELQNMMDNGKYREETAIHHFEKLAEIAAYNLNGGLKMTTIIQSSLIDHFVPFLPLERRHVEKCVRTEFRRLNHTATAEEISDIVENHVTYNGLFSRFGCKRLNKKVAVAAEQW